MNLDPKLRNIGWRRGRKLTVSDLKSVIRHFQIADVGEYPRAGNRSTPKSAKKELTSIPREPLLDMTSRGMDETVNPPSPPRCRKKRLKFSHGDRNFQSSYSEVIIFWISVGG